MSRQFLVRILIGVIEAHFGGEILVWILIGVLVKSVDFGLDSNRGCLGRFSGNGFWSGF